MSHRSPRQMDAGEGGGFLPSPYEVDLKSSTWFIQSEYISTNQIDQIGGHMSLSPEQASPPISQIARGYITTYKFSAAPPVGAENSWQGDIQLCNL